MPLNGLYPPVATRYKQLRLNELLDSQNNAIFEANTNRRPKYALSGLLYADFGGNRTLSSLQLCWRILPIDGVS